MNDVLKWAFRTAFLGVCWVFLLSITVSGRPMFFYLNQTLVQNDFVQMLDEEHGRTWDKVVTTARITFNKPKEEENL